MIDAYLWGRVRETERTSKANISHALPRNMQVGGSFSQKKVEILGILFNETM